MSLIEITSVEQRHEIINTNKVVVIDYYAPWCEPCKQCLPEFTELARKYGNDDFCILVKENMDLKLGERPEKIKRIPCFHVYINGIYQSDKTVYGTKMNGIEDILKNNVV